MKSYNTIDGAASRMMKIFELEQKRRRGAHVFYLPISGVFQVATGSRCCQVVDSQIFKNSYWYCGYFSSSKTNWTMGNIVNELVDILEQEARSFDAFAGLEVYKDLIIRQVEQ